MISKLIFMALILSQSGQIQAQTNIQDKTTTSTNTAVVQVEDEAYTTIADYIYSTQPNFGEKYAQRLAKIICEASREYGVSPYIIAATAKVESDFTMRAGPCIGIMQIDKTETREAMRLFGLDSSVLEDNIRIGAWCLARYGEETYNRKLGIRPKKPSRDRGVVASRGVPVDRVSYVRGMLGRYNGCGSKGKYVDRVLNVERKILTHDFVKPQPQPKSKTQIQHKSRKKHKHTKSK